MNAGPMGMAVNQKPGLSSFQGCFYRTLVHVHNTRCFIPLLDVATKSYCTTYIVSLTDWFVEKGRSPVGLVNNKSKILVRFVVCTQRIAVKKKYLPPKEQLNRSIL
jgi:hypothetical protein